MLNQPIYTFWMSAIWAQSRFHYLTWGDNKQRANLAADLPHSTNIISQIIPIHLLMEIGCFHLLAVVSYTHCTPWTLVYKFDCLLSILLDIDLEVELLDYIWKFSAYNFDELPNSSCQYFTLPPAVQGSNFSTISLTIVIFQSSNNCYPNECDVITSHFGFDLHFILTSAIEHLFMYLLTICVSSLGGTSVQVLYSFLNWVVLFLLLFSSPLSDIWFANGFSCFEGYVFTVLIMFFDKQRSPVLLRSNLSKFFSVAHSFGVIIKNPSSNPNTWRITP